MTHVPPEQITRETDRLKALQMRQGGAAYRQIAEKLKCGIGKAHELVSDAMAELHERVLETADRIKLMELARLDAMWMKLELRADNDAPRVIEAQLRIMERRSRLLGLDAPVRIEGSSGPAMPTSPNDARELLRTKVLEASKRMLAAAGPATNVTIVDAGPLPAGASLQPQEPIHDQPTPDQH